MNKSSIDPGGKPIKNEQNISHENSNAQTSMGMLTGPSFCLWRD